MSYTNHLILAGGLLMAGLLAGFYANTGGSCYPGIKESNAKSYRSSGIVYCRS